MKISISILSSNDIKNDIKKINVSDVDYIHLDIMDGRLVNNTSFSYDDLKDFTFKKPLDVHLMVLEPESYIDDFSKLNPEFITIHKGINNFFQYNKYIKEKGIKFGVAINPDEKIEDLFPYLKEIDLVLIMSVFPGFGGQKFIEDSINRIKKLKDYIKVNNLKCLVEVDGGINNKTSKLVDADMTVSGSYLIEDLNRIKLLKER
ncbi:MAG: ribulose-phosphate 3-epimerase [Bacilli bacterium]